MNKNIHLYHGDCLEVLKELPDNSIDMVLCDLPYGTTQAKWDSVIPFDELWKQYNRVAKDTTPIVLFGAEPFSSYLRLSNITDYKYDWIWDKIKGTNFLNAKKQPLRYHENIHVFYKKQCVYNPQKTSGHPRKVSHKKDGHRNAEVYNTANKEVHYDSTERYPRSILAFSTDSQRSSLHPTQKPVALLEYLIKTYTNEGMTILDNTMGSGSTGVACVNTNRKFIGIEKDEKYFNIAKNRIEEIKKKKERTLF